MTFDEFVGRMHLALPEGTELPNPGGGTTMVLGFDDTRFCYRRGSSRFCVGVAALYEAYLHHAGAPVSTTDLKTYLPEVFDSRGGGHNCHCTVLFLALQRMGLAWAFWGRGRSGAPFGVTTIQA